MANIVYYLQPPWIDICQHEGQAVADPEGVLGVPWNPPFDKTTTVHVLQADSVLVLTDGHCLPGFSFVYAH